MYENDNILTGERYRSILRDLTLENFESLEKFIEEFSEIAEDDFSDAFVHKMQTLCRFLIDIKAYKYVTQILNLSSTMGTYENKKYEGEECVITYAIRKIEDEDVIASFIESYTGGDLVTYFFEFDLPTMVAVDRKKYRTLKLLFEKQLCTEAMGYRRCTILQHAASNQDYELAEFALSELKHNPDLYGVVDVPPIALAADADDFKMVELLIKFGANVSATDGSGRTAICYCKSDQMINIFKANGAEYENSQMQLICRIVSDIKENGFATSDLIESLLKYENLLFCNAEGNIIRLACTYGDVETLEKLLPYLNQVEADDLIFDVFNWYRMDNIKYKKDVDKMIELTDILIRGGIVKESSGSLLSPYHTLSLRPELFLGVSDEKAFKLFDNIGKLGYRLDDKDFLGKNIFHDAIESLNISLIRYCLSKGMKYRQLDRKNINAVELLLTDNPICREYKESNIHLMEEELQRMLKNGCNINHQDKHGNTPLHNLTQSDIYKVYPIKLLLKYNPDLSVKNSMGDTAYDIGLRRGLPDKILNLLKP